jgi:shikimate 5-dehydrogenase
VGTGGAGRAAAEGLTAAGARVTLVNRSAERGERAASLLDLPFVNLDRFDPAGFDVLVNATSLGRGEEDALPFPLDGLRPGTAVVDLVYRETPTPLVRTARELGLAAVDGREVLLGQARGQLRLMTGREMPLDTARRILGLDDSMRTIR